jgi:hypothetical protein
MDRPRLIRGLRIAWSVAWGILCVLLIVLWVRSYWLHDRLLIRAGGDRVIIGASVSGTVAFAAIHSYFPELAIRRFAFINRAARWADNRANLLGFGYLRYSSDSGELLLPHWLFVAVSAALATAPWANVSNRFSLRTLLIATTLVAFVLGLVVWRSN